MTVEIVALFLASTIRTSTPIAYAALGATYSERSGIIHVGLEGIMLFGAFSGVLFAGITDSPWLGVLAAVAIGTGVGGLFGLICVRYQANQIVAGFGLNILALGATRFGLETIYDTVGVSPSVPGLAPLEIPVLSDLPLIGPALFGANALIYVLVLITFLSHLVLQRTRFGRRIEASGEFPEAADAAGINVYATRYQAQMIAGALAAVGGAFLSLGQLTYFVEGMTAGRGFIALAANIFGGWTALGAVGASLLFGAAQSLEITLQAAGVDVPPQALLVLPYVLTMAAVAWASRNRAPSAVGVPYARG
jgi:simple sugar transport system permease protein